MTKRAPFDSLAAAAADVLVRRMARGANADDREWLDAMSAEIGEIDGGWARLRWAFGAVRTKWECRRRRFAVASVVSIGGSRMTPEVTDRFRNPVNMIAYSAVGFFIWWICLGFAMRLANSGGASSWVVSELVMGFACLIGAALSHLLWGLSPFRDRATHVAIFLAAFVAPVFAAMFSGNRNAA